MKRYMLITLLLSSTAIAGLVVNEVPATFELRDAQSHVISKGYKTIEECWSAATTPGRYRCIGTHVADIVGVCDDVPPPAPAVDPQGFTVVGDFAPHECPTPDYVYFTQVQPVRDAYPSCAWVEKPIQVTDCTGKVIHPLMEDAHNSTTQTDDEPGPWLEGSDYPLGAPCPEAAHGNCYPSPNKPKAPPAGCTSEYCVSG